MLTEGLVAKEEKADGSILLKPDLLGQFAAGAGNGLEYLEHGAAVTFTGLDQRSPG